MPGCLPDTFQWRCSRHVQLGRDPGADPGHAVGFTWLAWECLGIPWDRLEEVPREKDTGRPYSAYCQWLDGDPGSSPISFTLSHTYLPVCCPVKLGKKPIKNDQIQPFLVMRSSFSSHCCNFDKAFYSICQPARCSILTEKTNIYNLTLTLL